MRIYPPSEWHEDEGFSKVPDVKYEGGNSPVEFTDKHEKWLSETKETTAIIKSVLLGVNGNPGLVRKVEESCKRQDTLDRRLTLLIGILIGLGIIAGGTAGILKVLGG